MKAIVKEPNKEPEVREIENTLEALKSIVGGYIEVVHLFEGVLLICNEEGKIQNLPPNFSVGHDVIVGTAIFVSSHGEDFAGLDDTQILLIMDKLYS